MVQTVETFGKTVKDFPETTYWFRTARQVPRNKTNKKGEYLEDNNNPQGYFKRTGTTPYVKDESGFINEDWDTFFKWTNTDRSNCVNLTSPWAVIQVHAINKIADRDYVIQFNTNRDDRIIPYVVLDCNHYQHAYNRFAKRVREQVNVRLGVNLAVADRRPQEEPAFPTTLKGLNDAQRALIGEWNLSRPMNVRGDWGGCRGFCNACQEVLDQYNARDTAQVINEVSQVKVVEKIVEKEVIKEVPVLQTFHIYLRPKGVLGSETIHMAEVDGALSALQSAQKMHIGFRGAGMTTAYIQVRDDKGFAVAEVTQGGILRVTSSDPAV